METRTFEVEVCTFEAILYKVEKANKRLEKRGYDHVVSVEEVSRFFRTVNEWTGEVREMVKFNITGAETAVGDWSFVAVIDHVGPESNVVRALVDGIDPKWFTAKGCCDHCGHNRARKKTILVQHKESGAIQQIGSTCVEAYTACFAANSVLAVADDIVGLCEDGERWASPRIYYSVPMLLAGALAVTEDGKAYQKGGVTRDETLTCLNGVKNPKTGKLYFEPPTDAQIQMGKDIAEWAKTEFTFETAKSDYGHNMATLVKLEAIGAKHIGYVVSLVAAYARHLGIKAEQAASSEKVNEYVGKVGDKVKGLEATYVRSAGFEGMYGYTFIHTFQDPQGRCLVWKTGNALDDVSQGDSVQLSGTIKAQTEYRGTKQTALTRCKVA